jgi:hypothetical protein
VVVVVVTKALAAKAFVKSTAVKCPVKAFAATKSFNAAKATTTVKDPSAVKAATTAVEVGNGR